tara:strand:+ start:2460 stop:5342 length:2883 start_codon:yes stop_codon:yes gene_type:complete
MGKYLLFAIFIIVGLTSFNAWDPNPQPTKFQENEAAASQWVDSVMATLSTTQKLQQLIVYEGGQSQGDFKKEKKALESTLPGNYFAQSVDSGLIDESAYEIFPFRSLTFEQLLDTLQASGMFFPNPTALGSVQKDSLILAFGFLSGQWMRANGFHLLYGLNGKILAEKSERANYFGSDKAVVQRAVSLLRQGVENAGVITVLTGFPGYDADAQNCIMASYNTLQSEPFFIYQSILEEGIGGVEIPAVTIPALDSNITYPIYASSALTPTILRNKWHYRGLVFANAIDLKNNFTESEITIYSNALRNGTDVFRINQQPDKIIEALEKAFSDSLIDTTIVDEHCRKVLLAKYWSKAVSEEVNTEELYLNLQVLSRALTEHSVVLLNNENELLPFERLDTLQLAHLSIGNVSNQFNATATLYANVANYKVGYAPTAYERNAIMDSIAESNTVIITVGQDEKLEKEFNEVADFIRTVQRKHKTVLVWLAEEKLLTQFDGTENAAATLLAWADNAQTEEIAAQLLFGGRVPTAKLSVEVKEEWPQGYGLTYREAIRFTYGIPEEFGISANSLTKIDSIAQHGIDEQAYPGCEIFVAKAGKVIYNKSFGHFTYEEKRAVQSSDIYDLASITKIGASIVSLMHLQDLGEVNLDQTLGDLIPDIVGNTEYANIQLRQMLAHQAGLKSWIPFYTATLVNGVPRYDVYSLAQNETYPYRVADGLYINKNYPDSILKRITDTPLNESGHYLYSDLGYYFLQQIIEQKTGMPLDQYVQKTFYQPLGMNRTSYLPREKFELEEIVPTEYDVVFRKQQIQGDVHDPGAAMMGGVAGHAGLFSTANDFAKLMQMFMQYGTYGGERFLKEETVKEYTKCQFCADEQYDNRRGAGFDKPVRDGGSGPTCNCVSYTSFGHTGFTGTIAWADPEEQIVFVFLSNRVYPSASNKKLIKMGIRTDIMQVIYDAVSEAEVIE